MAEVPHAVSFPLERSPRGHAPIARYSAMTERIQDVAYLGRLKLLTPKLDRSRWYFETVLRMEPVSIEGRSIGRSRRSMRFRILPGEASRKRPRRSWGAEIQRFQVARSRFSPLL